MRKELSVYAGKRHKFAQRHLDYDGSHEGLDILTTVISTIATSIFLVYALVAVFDDLTVWEPEALAVNMSTFLALSYRYLILRWSKDHVINEYQTRYAHETYTALNSHYRNLAQPLYDKILEADRFGLADSTGTAERRELLNEFLARQRKEEEASTIQNTGDIDAAKKYLEFQ